MSQSRVGKFIFLVSVGALIWAVMHETPVRSSASDEQQSTFLRLVNEVALPRGFVQPNGTTAVVDNQTGTRCNLGITLPRSTGTDIPALKQIETELRMSPLVQDIRRFNFPATVADHDIFHVDDHCTPLSYHSSAPRFRPPLRTGGAAFSLDYASDEATQSTELLLQHENTRTETLSLSDDVGVRTDLDVTGNMRGKILGPQVRIFVRDVAIADWHRDGNGLSIINNADAKSGYRIRLSDGRSSITLDRGDSAVFPPDVKAVIVSTRDEGDSGVKKVAEFSWRKAQARSLYEQDGRGHALWSRIPSSFEVRIVDALKLANRDVAPRVLLSLRPAYSAEFQRDLDPIAQAQDLYARRKPGKKSLPTRRVYGSIAMLDTMTGEILGVAGWPENPAPVQISNSEYATARKQEEFLKREVVGSVAKIPFSMAVLADQPALRLLKIATYDEGSTFHILGQNFSAELSDHSSRGCKQWIDLHCFVAKSLNRYAATLLALGAVSNPADIYHDSSSVPLGADSYSIGDSSVYMQPKSFVFANRAVARSAQDVTKLAWAAKMREMFDIETRTFTVGASDEHRQHLYMWRYALRDSSDPRASDLLWAFAEVSPEKEHLDLNVARDFRQDYLPIILGQGESTWSTVKIAETFARVVTNRRVQASFVQIPKDPAYRQMPPLQESPNPDFEAARNDLLAGMRDVVKAEYGTAKKWFPSVLSCLRREAERKGLTVEVYAKTGTPRVATVVSKDIQREIEKLDGELQIGYSKDGRMSILHNGKPIHRDDPVKAVADKSSPASKAFRFLATVNEMETLEDQLAVCHPSGGKLECPMPEARAEKDDDGRDFAMVVMLLKQNEVVRSVTLAFSIVKTSKSDPLAKLVKSTFTKNGPVLDRLGLNPSPPNGCK